MIMSTTTNDDNYDGMGYFESVKKFVTNAQFSPNLKNLKL
jgi:hypothetical protein